MTFEPGASSIDRPTQSFGLGAQVKANARAGSSQFNIHKVCNADLSAVRCNCECLYILTSHRTRAALTDLWPFHKILRCSFRFAAIRAFCSISSTERSISGLRYMSGTDTIQPRTKTSPSASISQTASNLPPGPMSTSLSNALLSSPFGFLQIDQESWYHFGTSFAP